MKRPIVITILMLFFCTQELSAQGNVLKPEKVFSLYFDSFVKYDENALTKLNDYLSPFLGKENTYIVDPKETYAKEVENLTQSFLLNFSEETATKSKNEAKDFFSVMLGNFKNAKYTVKDIKTFPNEYAKNQNIEEVSVEVIFKVPSRFLEPKFKDSKKVSAEELKKYLKSCTKEVMNSNRKVTTSQTFKLYQKKEGGQIYYWNGGPEELVWKLHEFYFKNFNSDNK